MIIIIYYYYIYIIDIILKPKCPILSSSDVTSMLSISPWVTPVATPSCAGVDVSVGMPLRWDPFGRDGVRRQEVKGDWCALREFTKCCFFRFFLLILSMFELGCSVNACTI